MRSCLVHSRFRGHALEPRGLRGRDGLEVVLVVERHRTVQHALRQSNHRVSMVRLIRAHSNSHCALRTCSTFKRILRIV